MDYLDLALRGTLIVLMIYVIGLGFRMLRAAFRGIRKLPRAAGSAAATAARAARTARDEFSEGWKDKA